MKWVPFFSMVHCFYLGLIIRGSLIFKGFNWKKIIKILNFKLSSFYFLKIDIIIKNNSFINT
jgi:hypothetical protein